MRRRGVRVPSLELWAITPTLVQRKPRRLPLTLLLLLHLLVAALIGVALGRPLLPGGSFRPTNTVVVLDTSTSMAAEDGGAAGASTRFAAAQAAAREIFGGAGQGDRIALVTLGATPRLLGRGGPEAAGELIGAVDGLAPAGPDGDLQAALGFATAAAQAPEGEPLPARFVVLTDPSWGSPGATAQLTTTAQLEWRTFGSAGANTAVVAFAARPVRSGGQQLYARVANFGDRQSIRTLRVVLDGAVVQTEPVRLEPGAEAEWSWPLPRDTRIAEARLSAGDPAPFDDSAAAVLTGGLQRRVQLVSAAPTTLERALRAQPGVQVSLGTPASYRHDPAADLAIFVGFVPETLPDIPALIVNPPRGNTLVPVTGTAAERDLRPDMTADPDFSPIDLRAVRIGRAAAIEAPAWSSVRLSAGETPLILSGIHEGQPRTIWTFDPAESNLSGRLAFPLLTAATLQTLLPRQQSGLSMGELAPEAMGTPGGASVAPGQLLAEPGVYRWTGREGSVAVNAINPDESDLHERVQPVVNSVAAGAPALVEEAGSELWRALLAGALLLVLLEWLYVHRHDLPWRTARPATRGRRTA